MVKWKQPLLNAKKNAFGWRHLPIFTTVKQLNMFWSRWFICERGQADESYMNRKFTLKVLQYFRWHNSHYLKDLSFDTTGEKLLPVEHDSYVTVVKAMIKPVN